MDDTENAREVAERYRDAWLAHDLTGIIDCYADDFSLHYFRGKHFVDCWLYEEDQAVIDRAWSSP